MDNKTVFARNLIHYLNREQKSQIEVATDLNIKPSTFSSWCTGQKMPRMDKIELLAGYFGILKSDLIEDRLNSDIPNIPGAFAYNPTRRIPIVGRVAAGMPILAEQYIEGYIDIDIKGNGEYFGLRVSGDSMNAAKIHDGDVVVVKKQPEVECGQIAVVIVNGYDGTVKRYYQNGSMVTLMPQSTNPEHQPQMYNLNDTEITVVGRIVESRTLFD